MANWHNTNSGLFDRLCHRSKLDCHPEVKWARSSANLLNTSLNSLPIPKGWESLRFGEIGHSRDGEPVRLPSLGGNVRGSNKTQCHTTYKLTYQHIHRMTQQKMSECRPLFGNRAHTGRWSCRWRSNRLRFLHTAQVEDHPHQFHIRLYLDW